MAGIAEIAAGVRCALEPVENALTSDQHFAQFFAELGWDVRASPGAMGTIRTAFAIGPAFDAALAVAQQLEAGGSTPSPALANSLREALVGLIDAFKSLSQAPPTGGLPAPLNSAAFWQEIGEAVADSLLLRHVQRAQPLVFALLRTTGLAEITVETPRGAGRIPYQRWNIRWDRLPRVIGEPDRLIREVWGWGGPAFDHALLDEILGQTLRALRVPARTAPPTAGLRETLVRRRQPGARRDLDARGAARRAVERRPRRLRRAGPGADADPAERAAESGARGLRADAAGGAADWRAAAGPPTSSCSCSCAAASTSTARSAPRSGPTASSCSPTPATPRSTSRCASRRGRRDRSSSSASRAASGWRPAAPRSASASAAG